MERLEGLGEEKVKTRYFTDWLRKITGFCMVPATGVELVTY
ncbi:hypothetical protein PSI23_02615 [Xenorhabdus sp. XENO-10]|uniref:Uncharacterized protein n=1 Tax=Xenorhabdus yunnanensis TaxID=3025878 RepID=A0ABT5LB07_9GAMM|nr:hypothetical protein [Xenorhabdus yunnanensis]MDC9588232.1 hypothetical protein [Xenorhabdus yunnanensis]